ncbi:hypothetical protein ACA910_008037 [Epithemia clementina (nom. ined.)]
MPRRVGLDELNEAFTVLDVQSDDLSITSTVDTTESGLCEEISSLKPNHFLQPKLQRQKQVIINEHANVSYANDQLDQDGVEELWYKNADFKRFKANNKIAAKRIAIIERECKDDPDSYRNLLERVHDACCRASARKKELLTSSDYKKLRKLVSIHYARVGTEKLSVYCLLEAKKVRRRQVIDTVLLIEEEQCQSFDHYTSSADERAQIIAQASRELSRPSSLFAALIAQAHQPRPASKSR